MFSGHQIWRFSTFLCCDSHLPESLVNNRHFYYLKNKKGEEPEHHAPPQSVRKQPGATQSFFTSLGVLCPSLRNRQQPYRPWRSKRSKYIYLYTNTVFQKVDTTRCQYLTTSAFFGYLADFL